MLRLESFNQRFEELKEKIPLILAFFGQQALTEEEEVITTVSLEASLEKTSFASWEEVDAVVADKNRQLRMLDRLLNWKIMVKKQVGEYYLCELGQISWASEDRQDRSPVRVAFVYSAQDQLCYFMTESLVKNKKNWSLFKSSYTS